MLSITPLRAERHWRQYSRETPRRPVIVKAAETETEKLRAELKKHKEAERRIKMHVKWMLRSTQATHQDAKDIAQIVKDLYGDD
jgi:hypothetical protein